MHTIKNENIKPIWILCDNDDDVWHLSEISDGQVVTTGQPNHREFKTKAEALAEIPKQYRDLES